VKLFTKGVKGLVALVVAGGRGKRLGADVPKQFLKIGGKEILSLTLERISRLSPERIIIAAPKDFIDLTEGIAQVFGAEVVEGGVTRQESVKNCIERCVGCEGKLVIVHDGVRPFFPYDAVVKCLKLAEAIGSATLAVRVKETVAVVENFDIREIPDRSALWRIQTPQCFRFELLKNAHMKAVSEGFYGAPDDTFLILRYSLSRVGVVEGDEKNIKITHEEDLKLAEYYFRAGI